MTKQLNHQPTVGFVGLGDQGGPMAEQIASAGHLLSVWARRPEALDTFTARGIISTPDLATLAARSDILAVCVRDDAGVTEVAREVLPIMKRDSILVIHSTVHPDTCRSLAAQANAFGITIVDAPVSGGRVGALSGTLTVMAGCTPEALDRCRPIFESFATLIVRVGEVGTGQLAKLINNSVMAANLAVAHESAMVGAELGLDLVALGSVISASSGQSFAHDTLARMPKVSDFAFGAILLRKDVRLLQEVGTARGVPVGGLTKAANRFLDIVDAAVAHRN